MDDRQVDGWIEEPRLRVLGVSDLDFGHVNKQDGGQCVGSIITGLSLEPRMLFSGGHGKRPYCLTSLTCFNGSQTFIS